MDDLLTEFLTETSESLDIVDVELVKFEQDPNNGPILDNIFRLVHTIKGTCGFLGLPRLEALAHAAETLMGKYRDGSPVTGDGVSLILKTLDRLKDILNQLGELGREPEGVDDDLISQLIEISIQADQILSGKDAASSAGSDLTQVDAGCDEPDLVVPNLGRELLPGEVSLEELERAFLEADGPDLASPQAALEAAAEAALAAKGGAEQPKTSSQHRTKSVTRDDHKGAASTDEGGGAKIQSIRVNVDTLEDLMTMVSELVLTRNQLLEISRREENNSFSVPLQRLSNVTAELQEGVMKTRMQPIGNAWQKLPRVVRDLAKELSKDIDLQMVGQETELDRQVLELIKDPLTHMVRNSADHGIEDLETRRAQGKPDLGTIRLSAYHEGGHIIIEISDDGKGIDPEKIAQKALDKGLVTEDELTRMSDQQIQKFVFAPGFSTAAKVTNISGRGVGMDVVKTNIDLIGGAIDLKSVKGEGSTFIIKIPLTLAIVSALIVQSAGELFAVPQLAVVELVHASEESEHKIEMLKDTPVLRLRNKLLPLVTLKEVMGLDGPDCDPQSADGSHDLGGFVIVTRVGQQTFGIVVDAVFHTEEIVVKPMSSALRGVTLFSGNTILGDGSVIMIIDPSGVAKLIGTHVSEAVDDNDTPQASLNAGQEKTSMLLFRAGSDEPKAVPLALVTRLEEMDVKYIERSNDRYMVQYRGQLMPLVFVNDESKIKSEGLQSMLVFTDDGRSMGLVVDEIVDIVEDYLNVEVPSDLPGLVGTAVVKGSATEIIDIGHYLPLAFEDWLLRKELEITSEKKSLLFVDDSPFFRNMLTPILKAAGYDVHVCDSAIAACEVLKSNANFDVIVSDIEMPDMDGFRFAELLKKNERTSHMPVIALSSLTSPEAIQKGREVGFFDYVAKFDRPGLIAALKDVHTTENHGAVA